VQTCPRVLQKCLRVAGDGPELCPTDPGERLAGRTADHDVDRFVGGAEIQPGAHARGSYVWIGQILRHGVREGPLVEIAGMARGGVGIGIKARKDFEACSLQPE
jgi:hypothetical protein